MDEKQEADYGQALITVGETFDELGAMLGRAHLKRKMDLWQKRAQRTAQGNQLGYETKLPCQGLYNILGPAQFGFCMVDGDFERYARSS